MTEEIKVIPTNGTSADDVKYAKRVEEIYIDGVNVAGCNDFYKEWDNWSGKDNYRCQDFLSGVCAGNNCYYKQLKRLEQENKDLKKQIESDKGLITIGGKQQYDMTMAYDKCKTALEEIREIAKQDCGECEFNNDSICCEPGDCEAGKLQIIQNKINEVLNS